MLTTIEGVYKHGGIELSEAPVGMDAARVLVTFLPAMPPIGKPKDQYGARKTSLPAALDLEEAIQEIRRESAKRVELAVDE